MGRGDKKSRKGKIFKGSYGVSRPKKTTIKTIAPIKKNAIEKKDNTVIKKRNVVKKKTTRKKQ
jgi:30S ribosomal protein S31